MEDLFGNEKIRTLGLYQPFAALMGFGKIETRFVKKTNKPPYPLGKYLIYSCQKAYDIFEGGLDGLCTSQQIDAIWKIMEDGDNDVLFATFLHRLHLTQIKLNCFLFTQPK